MVPKFINEKYSVVDSVSIINEKYTVIDSVSF